MNAARRPPSPGARPAPWGPLTGVRRQIARLIAGPAALPADQPAFACTILKVDRLGDFILATGAIQTLIRYHGAARCALVISPEAETLAAREFPKVTLRVVPAFAERLFREIAPARAGWRTTLAALSCEHLVNLRHQRSLYRDLLLRAIPAQRRWWLDGVPFGDEGILGLENPAGRYPATAPSGLARESVAHQCLLSAVLGREIQPEEIRPVLLRPGPADSAGAVVIAPLAADPIRDLRAPMIWRVLAAEPALAGTPWLLLGSAAQKPRLEIFHRLAPPDLQSRCVVHAGEPPARWLALINGARLVLAAESALAHAAAALDRPLVSLAGGGHPGIFAPWSRSERQQWLRHEEPCYGCDWQCPHPEPFCLTRIPEKALAAAVRAALAADLSAR